jgi:hypothetical protein
MGLPAKPPADSACICTGDQNQTLLRLYEAYGDSREFNQDIWQFALQLHALRAESIPDRILRRLVAQGLVAHALETTRGNARKRTMRQLGHLQFGERSCFALTAKGVMLAASITDQLGTGLSDRVRGPTTSRQPGHVVPLFMKKDDGCRELRLGEFVIKRFMQLARNQELVLWSFQEQNWARRIFDPIPPEPGLDSKRRLHNTILRLNRGQLDSLVTFHGDGTGQAISWNGPCGQTAHPARI